MAKNQLTYQLVFVEIRAKTALFKNYICDALFGKELGIRREKFLLENLAYPESFLRKYSI